MNGKMIKYAATSEICKYIHYKTSHTKTEEHETYCRNYSILQIKAN